MTSLSQKSINNSLTRSNSAEIAGFAMPNTSNIVSVDVGASGTQHVAQANGFFAFSSYSTTTDGFVGLSNIGNGSLNDYTIATSSTSGQNGSPFVRVFMPVKKGDIVIAYYGSVNFNSSTAFSFIYAEGEI